MSALPWFKFSPEKWRADSALRMCSPVARCLWIEMLCIMHEAEPRGHLLIKGREPDVRQLAIQVGMTTDEVAAGLAELEANEVLSRTYGGTIISRKMVRDTRKSAQQSQNRMGSQNAEKQGENDVGETNGATTVPPKSLRVEESKIQESPPPVREKPKFDEVVVPFASLDPVEDGVSVWNAMAARKGLAKVLSITTSRRMELAKRLGEVNIQGWAVAVARVEENRFFHGENGRKWKADFDWLVADPTRLMKVIEGGFEGSTNGRAEPTDRVAERTAAVFGPMARGAQAALDRRRRRRGGGAFDFGEPHPEAPS